MQLEATHTLHKIIHITFMLLVSNDNFGWIFCIHVVNLMVLFVIDDFANARENFNVASNYNRASVCLYMCLYVVMLTFSS